MKRILLLTATCLALLLLSAPGVWAFGVKDVVKMTRDGVADSLIVLKIENSGKTFHLDADDVHGLQEAGVSDDVIAAMLRTEGRDDYDYGYYPYAYYPHPYPYSYPRLYLGFGFHRYDSPYYGSRYYGGYRTYRQYRSYPNSGDYGSYRYRGTYGDRPPANGGTRSRTRR